METAAANSGTADIGAWTMGCSIPSRQTGVRTNTTYPSRSRSQGEQPVSTWTRRLVSAGRSTFSYDSYDEGIDSRARLSHP